MTGWVSPRERIWQPVYRYNDRLNRENVIRLFTNITSWYKDNVDEFDAAISGFYDSIKDLFPKWQDQEYYSCDRKILLTSTTPLLPKAITPIIDRNTHVYYYDDDERVNVDFKYDNGVMHILGRVPYGAHLHITRFVTDPYMTDKFSKWNEQYGQKAIQSSRGAKGYSDPYPGSRK